MNNELYIGLISGTSMDAVDCALIEISNGLPQVVDHVAKPMPAELKAKIQHLCSNQNIDLRLLGSTDIEVARLFADTVNEFLDSCGLFASAIQGIGSHGQTIWHEPPNGEARPAYSIQIGDPNTIAHRTGITTVADFRRRDMAAGGQGAPIVPVLHRALFQNPLIDRVVLNLGGIANITLLWKDGAAPIGFDTGPASVLMDGWIKLQRQLEFDNAGIWAASAEPDAALLALLLDEPYFGMAPPKSTGRELFNLAWLERKFKQLGRTPASAVVQATLLALTVESIAQEVERYMNQGEIMVCGGGARNTALLQRIESRLPNFTVVSTTAHGLDADFVEAAAFGWFAYRTLRREPMAFQHFTGASNPVIAGGIYYARMESSRPG
jgi:anhydro-N-acetylmuramic acid kinase